MKYRLFAAVNLPEEIKDQLVKVSDKWTELPVRWVKREDLHITLCFLGDVDEFDVAKIKKELDEAGRGHGSFPVFLTRLSLGPNEHDPKMIWATGEATGELKSLIKDIHDKVSQCECIDEKKEDFRLHVDLAKTVEKEGRLDDIWRVRDEINVSFNVESFELMESKSGPDGKSYQRIHSVSLK